MKSLHKSPDHQCENIGETEKRLKDELIMMLTESKKKVAVCDEAHQTLESSLNDLQMQRDNAKGLIQETFQSYKAMLEKQKVLEWEECLFTVVSIQVFSVGGGGGVKKIFKILKSF